MLGVHRAAAEVLDFFPRDDLRHLFILDDVYLLDLVRCTEAIEEVDERDLRSERRDVSDDCEVDRLLHGGRGEEGEPGLSRGHYVGVIAEDRQGVRGECASRHVEDGGQKLAGNLVHVRDHQKKPLRCSEGCGQGARCQRAVNRPGGPGFRLHLRDLQPLPKQIQPAVGRPRISDLPHRGTGRNRVDCRDIAEGVCDVGCRSVPVNRHHLLLPLCHCTPPESGSVAPRIHRKGLQIRIVSTAPVLHNGGQRRRRVDVCRR